MFLSSRDEIKFNPSVKEETIFFKDVKLWISCKG